MTLSQTATITRRAIVILVVVIVLVIGSKIGYQIWYQNYLSSLPKQVDRPDQKFGALPKISLSGQSISSSNYTYSIDTQTGNLPQLPTSLKIYFIPQAGISLLAPDRSKDLASRLGFANGPQILTPTSYQFTDSAGGKLIIDLPTGNFHLQKTTASDSAQLLPGFNQPSTDIIKDFKNYLTRNNLLPEELKNGRGRVVYSDTDPQKASLATISMWPSDFDTLPIMTPSEHGLIKAKITTASEDSGKKYLNLDYIYWPIDTTTFATYTLKSPQKAFTELQTGGGLVITEPLKPQVSLTNIYLAYFQTTEYTPYLQPVFVFEGPHFQALVPAVQTANPN